MSQSTCPHCGGSLMGDGYTTPVHCERISGPFDVAPDSEPILCEPEPGDREPFFPAPECNACGNCTPCRCDGTGNG